MPILGLHFIVAVFFAVHAIRNHREMYWLIILFSFPLLGSIVYFFAVYLSAPNVDRKLSKAKALAVKHLDPGKELREAQRQFELTPTAQHQLRLANALLEAGRAQDAVAEFDACLQGPFSKDPEIRLAAARARFESQQFEAALELLRELRAEMPNFRPETVGLRLAACLAALDRQADADAEFAALAQRYGSVEVRVEYAVWLLQIGRAAEADAQKREVELAMRHWNKHNRVLNKTLIERLNKAFSGR